LKYKIKKNLVWSLIPAKGYSKRIKKKNLKRINNISLVCYSVIFSKMNKAINKTFVSTDSEEIRNLTRKYKAHVPFLRPKKMSKYQSQDYEYVHHFLDYIKKNEKFLPEYILQLRPTTPFRSISLINKAIVKIKKFKNSDSLRSTHIASHPPEKQFRVNKNFYTDINSKKITNDNFNKPSHFFKTTYEPNGYIDILKTKFLLKNKNKIYGKNILSFVTPKTIDIDTKEDFEFAKNYRSSEKKIIIKWLKK
jgi:CMP-N-acetylneuraminic acid synthetase